MRSKQDVLAVLIHQQPSKDVQTMLFNDFSSGKLVAHTGGFNHKRTCVSKPTFAATNGV